LASNLKELKNVQKGNEMYVPMGAGIFVKAQTEETHNVVMNVGAGVCVEKTVDEAVH